MREFSSCGRITENGSGSMLARRTPTLREVIMLGYDFGRLEFEAQRVIAAGMLHVRGEGFGRKPKCSAW